MKYFKTKFVIKSTNSKHIDETTLATTREICAALAGYAGYESFEDTEDGIDGYIQHNLFDQDILSTTFSDFPIEGVDVKATTSEVEDKNWNEAWEKHGFDPIIINGKCRIHDLYSPKENICNYPIDIEIDAKQAFGTGTHNTTRMIVGEILDMDLKGKRVLDCGCGTGILSIIASKCGAKEITAYDIDEWSVDNTRHNAVINNVSNIDVLHGNVDILNEIEGTFDIVLANINRNILIEDMAYMTMKMRTDSVFIISGFYSEDVSMLDEKAKTLGLFLECQKTSENWTMLKYTKK